MTQGYIEKNLTAGTDDIEKINQFTRSEIGADSLYIFSVVLCNNDIDRDYEKFSLKTLEQLKDMFVGKTGIFDHSMKASDQKARIFDTYIERTEGRKTADGEALYQLKAKAYMLKSKDNMPLISEIEAGIKKEVSVSCSVERSICSICGKDKRSSGCEHFNGKSYNGALAYTILEDAKDAYEFSFVAVPAQREAGVTKSFDYSKKGITMADIIKNLRDCENQIVLSKSQAQSLADKICSLDEEAQLGREYKRTLANEVISLCSRAMPTMDLKVFGNVANVMTTKELLAFKKAFTKAEGGSTAQLQFKNEKASQNVNQFKI